MNSFISWVGGKMLLRDIILERFPCSFETYAEVFCGAAWVFFHKPRSKNEVINDMNRNLANLFWQVQENSDALCERLRYDLDCEANFYRMRDALKKNEPMDDLTRAAWFFQVLRFSYGSKATSYSWKGRDIWRDFPTITAAHHRLRGVGIHNKEFEHFIRLMDALDTFFYCDPPYWGTEGYYDGVVFGIEDRGSTKTSTRWAGPRSSPKTSICRRVSQVLAKVLAKTENQTKTNVILPKKKAPQTAWL